jgi:uncharacterized protein GlcG (DUF336 family)
MLLAAVDNANSIKVPMCIVDGGGHLIAFTRLENAVALKVLQATNATVSITNANSSEIATSS